MLRPFKFIMQVVLLEQDEDGNIIGEKFSEQPEVLYGIQAVRDYLDKLEAELK